MINLGSYTILFTINQCEYQSNSPLGYSKTEQQSTKLP